MGQSQPSLTHYQVLGVHNQATPDDIRSAFRALALSCHPDKRREAPAAGAGHGDGKHGHAGAGAGDDAASQPPLPLDVPAASGEK